MASETPAAPSSPASPASKDPRYGKRARQQLTEALKLQRDAAWSSEADKVLGELAAAK